MREDRQLSADAGTAVPWWFERGVGLLLVLLVGAVLWAISWTITSQVHGQPPMVTPEWEGAEAVAVPRGPDPSLVTATRATNHALQADVLRERRQERIQRAQRADRDLAVFLQSIGVVGPLTAWVAPLSGDYRVTATFGQHGSLWSKDHTGVDLATTSGTPVVSVAAGTVTSAGDAGAYGMRVEVRHLDGTQTSYSHLSRIDVVQGQAVEGGTALGAVGSTGNSTGPHLHLELQPAGGVDVDPVPALLARGVVIG